MKKLINNLLSSIGYSIIKKKNFDKIYRTLDSSIKNLLNKKDPLIFDVGAHKDFLVDGENALVSPMSDLDKMIKDMQLLIEDPSLWKKLSSNARATFEQVTYFDQNDSVIKSLNL